MADRVNHLGRFPFCVDTGGTVGPGTQFPTAMTLDEATALYWRSRRWKVTITIDGDDGTFQSDMVISDPAQTGEESKLVCLREKLYPETIKAGVGGSPRQHCSMSLFSQDVAAARLREVGGSYYPYLDTYGQLWLDEGVVSGGSPTGLYFGAVYYHSNSAAAVGADLFTGRIECLPGTFLDLPVYYDATDWTITQLDYEVAEWYSYSDLAGNPVYNTTTGAQLTDPFG